MDCLQLSFDQSTPRAVSAEASTCLFCNCCANLDGTMAPGSSFLRVVTRLIPARYVASNAPEFITAREFGSLMDFSVGRRAVSVNVASSGQAAIIGEQFFQ